MALFIGEYDQMMILKIIINYDDQMIKEWWRSFQMSAMIVNDHDDPRGGV